MKFRLGFVSNSSSSSFVCDICNETFSGWDASPSDFDGVRECQNGHIICCHSFEDNSLKDKLILAKESMNSSRDHYKNQIEILKEKLAKDEFGESSSSGYRSKSECTSSLSWYEKRIQEDFEEIERLNSFDFDDFSDLCDADDVEDLETRDFFENVLDNLDNKDAVSSEKCPICSFSIVSNSDLKSYMKKKGMLDETMKEIKKNFGNYTEFRDFLKGK